MTQNQKQNDQMNQTGQSNDQTSGQINPSTGKQWNESDEGYSDFQKSQKTSDQSTGSKDDSDSDNARSSSN
jgi:hypothetical protein